MIITITNTRKIVHLESTPARIWIGETEAGVPVHVYVTRISPQTHDAEALRVFDAELAQVAAPTPAVDAIPLRLIL